MSEQQQQRHREVLKAHGYRLPEGERERARAFAAWPAPRALVEAFEGRSETAR